MTVKYSPLDCLKFAAVLARDRVEWASDSIMGNQHMTEELEEATKDEFDCLHDLSARISDLSTPWVKDREAFWRYSDGRPIETALRTIPGVTIKHAWDPDPDAPAPKSWEYQASDGSIYLIEFVKPSTITATQSGYWQPRLHSVQDD